MALNKLGAHVFCLVFALCLLAGCADTPSKEAKPEMIAPDPSGKIAQVIPNPYLQHSGDAPAAAKTEFTRIQGLIKTVARQMRLMLWLKCARIIQNYPARLST